MSDTRPARFDVPTFVTALGALVLACIALITAAGVPGRMLLFDAKSEDGRVEASLVRQQSGLELWASDHDRRGQSVTLRLDSAHEPSLRFDVTGKGGDGWASGVKFEGGVLDFSVKLKGRQYLVTAEGVAKMFDDLYDRLEAAEAEIARMSARPLPAFKPRRYP